MDNERNKQNKKNLILVATKKKKADLVLKNATFVNVFSNELNHGDIAIYNGKIAGIGEYQGKQELDLSNSIVLPGFIDSHIHLESSLLAPKKAAFAMGVNKGIDPFMTLSFMGLPVIPEIRMTTRGLFDVNKQEFIK